MLTISGKALSQRRPLFPDWAIPLPPDLQGATTLRALIERVVRVQIAAFRKRQTDSQLLRVLTSRQIEQAAEQGKVAMGAGDVKPQPVDEEAAVAAALQAFEDGLYLVAIDGADQRSLDAAVHLHADSRVVFIRLVLLAGG